MTFTASNGAKVRFEREYSLRDGGTVRYFEANGWSFSDQPDEDADLEYAKKAAAAWQAWLEFLESGGPNV